MNVVESFRTHTVIEMGAYNTRAGHSQETAPSYVSRSLVARRVRSRDDDGDVLVGNYMPQSMTPEQANEYAISAALMPARDGSGGGAALDVSSWGDVEVLLAHALRKTSTTRPVLLGEPLFSSLSAREASAQLLFETFDVPAICLIPQPLLTLYACGVHTGLTIDVGLHATRVVPVVDGRVLRDAAHAVPVGGLALTAYLQALLRDRAKVHVDALDAQTLKETHAFVRGGVEPSFVAASVDANGADTNGAGAGRADGGDGDDDGDDMPLDEGPDVNVPGQPTAEGDGADTSAASAGVTPLSNAAADAMRPAVPPVVGTIFTFAKSGVEFDCGAHASLLAQCTEPLFDPSLVGRDAAGLAETIASATLACEPFDRAALLSNVCLAGGSSVLRGLGARIMSEVRSAALLGNGAALAGLNEATFPYLLHVAPGDRQHTNWLGGAIIAQQSTFSSCWCPKAAYDEQGPFVIHSKSVL
jgi:actin-related protein